MPKPSGARTWDVTQSAEVDLDDVLVSLEAIGKQSIRDYSRVREQHADAELLAITEKQRAVAALKVAAASRDGSAYWTRVLVEKANAAGVSQRDCARALGVSTQTVNRWLKEPVGFDLDDQPDSE